MPALDATRAVFNRTARPVYVRTRHAVVGLLERRAGIQTEGHLRPDELGFDGTYRQRYQPSGWTRLRKILPQRQVGPDDVFIDFGSGMGRVVYQAAAQYPFKRVIGVELSEQLHRIAQENIDRNRERLRCQDVELASGDVLDYEIPPDVTVAFFANPFTGPVFQKVIERLVASVDSAPRRLRLIYLNPVEEEFLLGTGRFRMVRATRGMRPTPEWSRSNSIRMYELLPSGGTPE